MNLPVPSLKEQQRIATRLGSVAMTADHVASQGVASVKPLKERLLVDAAEGASTMRFGDVFDLQRRPVDPRPGVTYTEIGVRSFGRGLFVKPTATAESIGAKRVFQVHAGDLVISNIFAWEGAVALADEIHHGAIGSHRFMTWTPHDDIDERYAVAYFTSAPGVAQLRAASPGSTGRNRTLGITALRGIRFPVPEKERQSHLIDDLSQLAIVEGLIERRNELAAALLPSARNEEFSRLVAEAR